jgi:hypothetical protein
MTNVVMEDSGYNVDRGDGDHSDDRGCDNGENDDSGSGTGSKMVVYVVTGWSQ